MVICYLDNRELHLKHLLEQDNETFLLKTLDLGDILFHDEEKDFKLLIERKTYPDLQASLRDSRFREQRSRLLQWRTDTNHKFIYLIEGIYNDEKYHIEKRTIERLMISYQIPVLFSDSIHSTKKIILDWKSMESLDKLFHIRNIEIDQIEARNHHTLKKNYDDKKLFFMDTLLRIKGISSSLALSLGNNFNSISSFLFEFYKNPIEWEHKLKNTSYQTNKGNTKKINDKIIDKIKVCFDIDKN